MKFLYILDYRNVVDIQCNIMKIDEKNVLFKILSNFDQFIKHG